MPPLASLRRSVAASPRRTDAVVAAVLAAISLAQVLVFPIAPHGVGVAIALCSTVPIAFRRPHPVAAAVVGVLPWGIETDGYLIVGYVAVLLLFDTLAAEVDDLRVVAAVAAFALALSVSTLIRIRRHRAAGPGRKRWPAAPGMQGRGRRRPGAGRPVATGARRGCAGGAATDERPAQMRRPGQHDRTRRVTNDAHRPTADGETGQPARPWVLATISDAPMSPAKRPIARPGCSSWSTSKSTGWCDRRARRRATLAG